MDLSVEEFPLPSRFLCRSGKKSFSSPQTKEITSINLIVSGTRCLFISLYSGLISGSRVSGKGARSSRLDTSKDSLSSYVGFVGNMNEENVEFH